MSNSEPAIDVMRRALEAVLNCETYHDEKGHAFLAVPARSLNDLGAQIKFVLDAYPVIGSGTDSQQEQADATNRSEAPEQPSSTLSTPSSLATARET